MQEKILYLPVNNGDFVQVRVESETDPQHRICFALFLPP